MVLGNMFSLSKNSVLHSFHLLFHYNTKLFMEILFYLPGNFFNLGRGGERGLTIIGSRGIHFPPQMPLAILWNIFAKLVNDDKQRTTDKRRGPQRHEGSTRAIPAAK
jgi:hypothetical protein